MDTCGKDTEQAIEHAQMTQQAQADDVGWPAHTTIGSASEAPLGGPIHGQGGRNTEHALHKAEQAQTHVHVQTQEPTEQEHANMQVRTQELEGPHGGRVIGQVSNTAQALRGTRLEQAGGQGKAHELGIAQLRELIRQMQGALEQTKVIMHQVQAKVKAQLREMASAVIYGRHWKKR